MTLLSVNVNKIALLRNSRGHDYPSVVDFVDTVIRLGARGITVHPRPDERHITRKDVLGISHFLRLHPEVEFNIEGYPSPEFIQLVQEAKPDQCTLVPDAPGQLTSDHGWDVPANEARLREVLAELRAAQIRSCLFLDPEPERVAAVKSVGADRIELYTEDYARNFGLESEGEVWQRYADTAAAATAQGLGVNAGHDLNLDNLGRFLEIPDILEVSIGHALVVECLHQGVDAVIPEYLAITGA
ncbi:MAG: pyridoxine 5'-phosphate synthase [Pseudohongiellaceae bacterium]|jgi:pyridoxine 5-phosphate synthase